jgi:hypothetical protein
MGQGDHLPGGRALRPTCGKLPSTLKRFLTISAREVLRASVLH